MKYVQHTDHWTLRIDLKLSGHYGPNPFNKYIIYAQVFPLKGTNP